MPTIEGVRQAFGVLTAAGLPTPPAWVEQGLSPDAVARSWTVILGELPDVDLTAAAAAYARSPRSQYWPTPGQLLEQLRETPAGTDTADEWWGRLRTLRREREWYPPLRPEQPEPWSLSPSPIGARVLWAALEAIGGWAGYHERPERVRPEVEVRIESWRVWVARWEAADEHALAAGRRQLSRSPGEPTREQRQRLAAWLATATPERAERALAARRARHGPQDSPRDPTARVAPWRLSDDESEEARVWAALDAVGGWVAIPPRGGEEDPGIAAQRASFRLAFRSYSARTARREETQAVAALAEGIGHLRQISG